MLSAVDGSFTFMNRGLEIVGTMPRVDKTEQSKIDAGPDAVATSASASGFAERIAPVLRSGVAGALAALVVSSLYALAIWPVADRALLLGWFVAVNLIGVWRVFLALHWKRAATRRADRFWAANAIATGALSGLAWGYAAVVIFPFGHPELYFVAAFLLIGMPAGALTSYGTWLPAYAGYVLGAVGPFATWMLLSGERYFVITGVAAIVFAAFLLRQGKVMGAAIARSAAQRVELERMANSLIEARDAAQAASRAKSSFLANMSHELRTPLSAVVGLSDLLVEQPQGANSRDFAVTIRKSALSLLGVIDNVLDMGRIETGRLELRPRGFDAREMLHDVHAMFLAEAERKRLKFNLDIDGGVPTRVIADPDRLRQVLVNLIDNSLKFTVAGTVSVAACADAAADGRHLLRFEVSDTGIGIAPRVRERLFGKSAKGDDSTTQRHGGAGLGLRIATELVALMNGEIDYRSEVGKGTTFWFTAVIGMASPIEAPAAASTTTPVWHGKAAPRVLIVEDNLPNRLLTQRMLESIGCSAEVAASGIEALGRLQSASFDLVFMDMSMPGMDGHEATRVWRAHEASADHRLPIVALTANAMAGDRQQCIAAGMDDYLSKPVTVAALRRMVERHLPAA